MSALSKKKAPKPALKRLRKDDPRTPEEWQEHLNIAAYFYACGSKIVHEMEGEPLIYPDLGRCYRILQLGAERGYHPLPTEELLKIFSPEPGWEVNAKGKIVRSPGTPVRYVPFSGRNPLEGVL